MNSFPYLRQNKRRTAPDFIEQQPTFCNLWEIPTSSILKEGSALSKSSQSNVAQVPWKEDSSDLQPPIVYVNGSSRVTSSIIKQDEHQDSMEPSSFTQEQQHYSSLSQKSSSSLSYASDPIKMSSQSVTTDTTSLWTSFQDELATDAPTIPLLDTHWNYLSSAPPPLTDNMPLSSTEATMSDWSMDNLRRSPSLERLSPLVNIKAKTFHLHISYSLF
jgi:hypothetical protein